MDYAKQDNVNCNMQKYLSYYDTQMEICVLILRFQIKPGHDNWMRLLMISEEEEGMNFFFAPFFPTLSLSLASFRNSQNSINNIKGNIGRYNRNAGGG